MSNIKDISNRRFGRLAVKERTDKKDKRNNYYWRCECDCGKTVLVTTVRLLSKNVQSCGCMHDALSIIRLPNARAKISFVDGTSVNNLASSALSSLNKSGCRGVCWDQNANAWRAYISFKKRRYYLGLHHELNSACDARNKAENNLYGNFLNWYAETYPDMWDKIKTEKE